ncbi:MAG: hypothetical protein AAGM22_28640, partial [Acidobacteriota bacterium]
MFRSRRFRILLTGCASLLLLFCLQQPRTADPERQDARLRVVASNILDINNQPTLAAEALRDFQPDIIVLLEWKGDNADLDVLLRDGYSVRINNTERRIGLLTKSIH